MELEDKVIVTTGAGRGIGASAAGLMARNGAKVVIADIRETGDKRQQTIYASPVELRSS